MMDGVEILAQEEITEWCFHPVILVVCAILLTITVWYCATNEDAATCIGMFIIGSFLTIYAVVLVGICVPQGTGKYQYKVLLDDTTPMVEFYDKYEIVNQEGRIFTIQKKE